MPGRKSEMHNILIVELTLSPPIPLRHTGLIHHGGLHQYGAEPFEQQQFGTAGVEGVNIIVASLHQTVLWLQTP